MRVVVVHYIVWCLISGDVCRTVSKKMRLKTSAEQFVVKSEFQTFTDCRSLYRLAVSWWWCYFQLQIL